MFFCAPQSRLQITIDVPLSSACSSNLGPRARCQWQWSVCHPPILGHMLHSAFINKMVQGGNIICPWSMFKLQTFVPNSFNNNLTEVIQTCSSTVLKNRTGPAPDLWPRSMMMQKAFYDGWVDAAARAAGLPPPAAGYLGMKFSRWRKRVQQTIKPELPKDALRIYKNIYDTPGLGEFQSGGCTAGSKYVDGFWTLQGQGLQNHKFRWISAKVMEGHPQPSKWSGSKVSRLGWLPQLSPNHVSMFKADTVNCGFDSPFVRHDCLLLKSIMGHYSVMCLQSVKTTFRTPMTPPLTPAVQAPVARQYETIRINSRWSFTSTMECSSKGINCYNSVRFCCIVWRLPYVVLGLTRIRNLCFGIPHKVSVWPLFHAEIEGKDHVNNCFGMDYDRSSRV